MRRVLIRTLLCIGLCAAMAALVAGCGASSTPPGASFVYGQVLEPEGFAGSFTALKWKEGLTVLLLDDIASDHSSSGSGSTAGPIWRGQGGAVAPDGRQMSWRTETSDGKTASFFINRQPYDLAQGTLFLIRTRGGMTQIVQEKRDLAGRCADAADCEQWLRSDPAAAQFIRQAATGR